ncbi:hypothetical protein GDO81_002599 [Engystomops pustulosus]|uniref:Uncharacterized protein n=1 Tax=Engystomops pustulosus TaxID=76066 RepID=A0AAV7DM30_ENGPU|nr:hypothetical protein GDO81_002599 [Engystomops pustulosus]
MGFCVCGGPYEAFTSSYGSMKQFTMQIEAWKGMEAAPCTLGAAAGGCCIYLVIIMKRNNSPGGKLGINFDGNRSLWLVMELMAGDEQCVCLKGFLLPPGTDPRECGYPDWTS